MRFQDEKIVPLAKIPMIQHHLLTLLLILCHLFFTTNLVAKSLLTVFKKEKIEEVQRISVDIAKTLVTWKDFVCHFWVNNQYMADLLLILD